VTPALAATDFWLVRDPYKKCRIYDFTIPGTFFMGEKHIIGKYSSEAEAKAAMAKMAECN
jgi:hypothetical protein